MRDDLDHRIDVLDRVEGQNVVVANYLVSNPCQDACGTIETNRDVRGAPIYLCPGCDSEWYEPREQTTIVDDPEPRQQQASGVAGAGS